MSNCSYMEMPTAIVGDRLHEWFKKADETNKQQDERELLNFMNNVVPKKGMLWWKRSLTRNEAIKLLRGKFWSDYGGDRFYLQREEMQKLQKLVRINEFGTIILSSDHAAILYREFR